MENKLILCYENKVLQTLDSNTKMKKITSQCSTKNNEMVKIHSQHNESKKFILFFAPGHLEAKDLNAVTTLARRFNNL